MKKCLNCGRPSERESWTCESCGSTPPVKHGTVCFAPDISPQEIGFQADFYPSLAAVEERHFWFRSRLRLIRWVFSRFFANSANLLEIGCGTGFMLSGFRQSYPNLKLTGSEVLSEGLDVARQRLPGARLLQMDARKIPFFEEFDVVCAFDVIEHIEDHRAVLRQMWESAKPGGGIIITVPQHPWLWSGQDVIAGHRRRYRRNELRNLLQEAGFKPVFTTSFVSLLMPLMALSRLGRKDIGKDPMAETRIHPICNSFLKAIMAAERLLIRMGISFPAGGSLLVVARKS